jgi:lipid A 3-O-deacylase
MRIGTHLRSGLLASLALIFASVAPLAQAQATVASDAPRFGVSSGQHRDLTHVVVWYESAPWATWQFSGSSLSIVPEWNVGYLSSNRSIVAGNANAKNAYHLGMVPMLRWQSGAFFVEGGIGATFFSRTQFGNRNISTSFQFQDHLGVGYHLTPATSVGLRYTHYSNADIKKPNPGLETWQFTLRTRF